MDQEKITTLTTTNPSRKKMRFCYFSQMLDHPSLDREIAASIKKTIDTLRDEGHEVVAKDFDLLDYIVPAYYVLTTAEASSNLSRYDGIRYGHRSDTSDGDLATFYLKNRSEAFGKEVKRRIMLGTFVLSSGYYDAYYNKAQQVRRLLSQHISKTFEEADAIILPTSPTTAFPFGGNGTDPIAIYLADIFTVFANLAGVPAISIPMYRHSNGLPFGIQVMTNRGDEVTLLQASREMFDNIVVT